jgi:hypothetical protein
LRSCRKEAVSDGVNRRGSAEVAGFGVGEGIEARVKDGVLHLRLPKSGPAKQQRIEVKAD